MYSYLDNVLTENVRKNKIETAPQTFEELFGEDYNLEMRTHFREKEYPSDEMSRAYYRDDPVWRAVVDASAYALIRLCGRKAQHNSENRYFPIDDAFRMYGYGYDGRTKYRYNPDAHFWVFYIGTLVPGDRAKQIWIQSPNSDRAHRYTLARLSPRTGLSLSPYNRDVSAYGLYIKPFEVELERLTVKFNDLFKSAFDKADLKLNEAIGRREDIPAYSDSVWPQDPLLYM